MLYYYRHSMTYYDISANNMNIACSSYVLMDVADTIT